MMSLNKVTLSRGVKTLFADATFSIFAKQKFGVIGKNGCGKSSLFAMILGELQPDAGEFLMQAQVSISLLAQHIPNSDETAVDFVLGGDKNYQYWQDKARLAKDAAEIMQCHEQLQNMDAYSKNAQAATILSGLGFSHQQQALAVSSFSGGWRMRLGLARCLMNPADFYLLDEPTNHLDLDAIIWLEKWLKQLPAAVLVISHDREFLDNTVDKILHIDNQQCTLYSGNYSYFEIARAEQLLMQQSKFVKQQAKIKHMMAFVEKFKAKATKAKQAQSRLKAIEKMELVANAHLDNEFAFEFLNTPSAGHPLLKCNHLAVGYVGKPALINDIQFMVQAQDRIGIIGPNGQGKSTLIKTLSGELTPLSGELFTANGLKIGYFAQHQVESLDMTLSPLQTIQALDKTAREQDIRNFLGGFNFHGDTALANIKHFSGGEKARLALAKLVWLRPNLLLLDEPTNHLDLDMRAAIEIALQSFTGAVIIISHDRHLMQTCVNDFYLIANQSMQEFSGDLNDYSLWINQKDVEIKNNTSDYKEIKALQNKIKRLETQIAAAENSLALLGDKLCDVTLYETGKKMELEQLQSQQVKAKETLAQCEDEWLICQQLLDSKSKI